MEIGKEITTQSEIILNRFDKAPLAALINNCTVMKHLHFFVPVQNYETGPYAGERVQG